MNSAITILEKETGGFNILSFLHSLDYGHLEAVNSWVGGTPPVWLRVTSDTIEITLIETDKSFTVPLPGSIKEAVTVFKKYVWTSGEEEKEYLKKYVNYLIGKRTEF